MTLKLLITHSVLQITAEKRYSADITVGDLKKKLEMVVGTSPGNQILQLRDKTDEVLQTLQPDDVKLSTFNLKDYDNIHVVDCKPQGIVQSLNNFNQGKVEVKKYEIDQKKYDQRTDTFAAWKKQNKKHFDKIKEKKQLEQKEKENEEKEEANKFDKIVKENKIKIGQRFQEKKGSKNRGEIKYVGDVKGLKKGIWIGIEFDEPFGNFNGTKKGKVYWKGKDKYCKFVRPDEIDIGDYPEKDELADLDIENEDDDEL